MSLEDDSQAIKTVEAALTVGQWRGKIEKTVEILEKTTTTIGNDVKSLQGQVTKLVVVSGFAAFVGSAVVSVIVGLAIKLLAK